MREGKVGLHNMPIEHKVSRMTPTDVILDTLIVLDRRVM